MLLALLILCVLPLNINVYFQQPTRYQDLLGMPGDPWDATNFGPLCTQPGITTESLQREDEKPYTDWISGFIEDGVKVSHRASAEKLIYQIINLLIRQWDGMTLG